MAVYVNEVGYEKAGYKLANVVGADSIKLCDKDGNVVKEYSNLVYEMDILSCEETAIVDFSDFEEEGWYYFLDSNGLKSCEFTISTKPFKAMARDTLKMFYYQRCGCELEEKYAGMYKHKKCHTNMVRVLSNPDIQLECSGGWHDAGDYGRYATAGAVAVGHLLYAFLMNPHAFKEDINIPESGNGIPDILNECRYELDWLLKMQTEDGGVYHKCTSMNHAPFYMPEKDNLQFYATPVSSMATADFVAVCALASRIYAEYDKDYSEKLKAAAVRSDKWLIDNPGFIYINPVNCKTGEYGDFCDADERVWAAAEMYRLTRDEAYLTTIRRITEMNVSLVSLGWMDVGGFATFCILTGEDIFPERIKKRCMALLKDEAQRLARVAEDNMYMLAMHEHDFCWGSNLAVMTAAMNLLVADRVFGEFKYLAVSHLDYLLGRNAIDTSFVTGYGEHAYNNPHNRPTVCDGIDKSIPGFVSGGPNYDHCDVASKRDIKAGTAPMKSYTDDWESYSTNEITIYWNSPMVFILSFFA